MRILPLLLALASCTAWALDQTDSKNFKPVEALALKGDYQAQRNLAFGYVDMPYIGQAKNPIQGCAWYLVVLHSGARQVGVGDVGNARVHCDKLDPNARAASDAQARELYRTIYKRPPKF